MTPLGNVRQAHGGFDLVHVLAAFAAGTVGIDAQVFIPHDDVDLLLGVRGDVNRGETRVALLRGVKGRDAHEAMHAALGLQEAEGVFADDFERGGACAHVVTGFVVDELDLVATALAPALIHAHEHVRPVAGLRATGSGVDGDEGIATVKRPAEELAELKGAHVVFELRVLLIDLTPGVHVTGLLRQVDEPVEVTARASRSCSGPIFFLMTFVRSIVFRAAFASSQKPGAPMRSSSMASSSFNFGTSKIPPELPQTGLEGGGVEGLEVGEDGLAGGFHAVVDNRRAREFNAFVIMEKTEAILIGRTRYAESSLIVQWCSPDQDFSERSRKVRCGPNRRFNGVLDLFVSAELRFVRSKSGDLHTLAEARWTNPRLGLRESYGRVLAATYLVKLITPRRRNRLTDPRDSRTARQSARLPRRQRPRARADHALRATPRRNARHHPRRRNRHGRRGD
jgi:hypothetical protein